MHTTDQYVGGGYVTAYDAQRVIVGNTTYELTVQDRPFASNYMWRVTRYVPEYDTWSTVGAGSARNVVIGMQAAIQSFGEWIALINREFSPLAKEGDDS